MHNTSIDGLKFVIQITLQKTFRFALDLPLFLLEAAIAIAIAIKPGIALIALTSKLLRPTAATAPLSALPVAVLPLPVAVLSLRVVAPLLLQSGGDRP
jgi:hypothetical protein